MMMTTDVAAGGGGDADVVLVDDVEHCSPQIRLRIGDFGDPLHLQSLKNKVHMIIKLFFIP